MKCPAKIENPASKETCWRAAVIGVQIRNGARKQAMIMTAERAQRPINCLNWSVESFPPRFCSNDAVEKCSALARSARTCSFGRNLTASSITILVIDHSCGRLYTRRTASLYGLRETRNE